MPPFTRNEQVLDAEEKVETLDNELLQQRNERVNLARNAANKGLQWSDRFASRMATQNFATAKLGSLPKKVAFRAFEMQHISEDRKLTRELIKIELERYFDDNTSVSSNNSSRTL